MTPFRARKNVIYCEIIEFCGILSRIMFISVLRIQIRWILKTRFWLPGSKEQKIDQKLQKKDLLLKSKSELLEEISGKKEEK